MEDKRRSARIGFHLSIQIKGRQGSYKSRNFSLGGLFVETEVPPQFKAGEQLELTITIPNQDDPIQVKGWVIHVTRKGIGVEFLDLPPQDTMALEWCFHVFEGTIPYYPPERDSTDGTES